MIMSCFFIPLFGKKRVRNKMNAQKKTRSFVSNNHFYQKNCIVGRKEVNGKKIIVKTIFVHGTLGLQEFRNAGLKALLREIRQLKKNKKGELIEKNKIKRWDESKYTYPLNCGPGVHAIDFAIIEKNINKLSVVLQTYYDHITFYKSQIQENINLEYDKKFSDNDFEHEYYIYNWSGSLEQQERIEAAKMLAEWIGKSEKEAEKEEAVICWVIIGLSHGGNIILNLAHYANQGYFSRPIDFIFLVGTPLFTSSFCKAEARFEKENGEVRAYVFKKISMLYSNNDLLQVGDITNPEQWRPPSRIFGCKKRKDGINNILIMYDTDVACSNIEQKERYVFSLINAAHRNNFYMSLVPNFFKKKKKHSYFPGHMDLFFYHFLAHKLVMHAQLSNALFLKRK